MFPWRIAFAAGSAGQTLTVTLQCATKHGTDGGVELAGATLAGPEPRLLTSPAANNTNWLGQTQTFSVTVEGIGPFTYQWYKGTPGGSHTALTDGGQISGATSANLAISNLVSGNAGSYYVVVTSTYGSVTSGAANLTILGITGTISGFIDTHLPSTVDLTAEGNLDWGHWGLVDENSVDVKATGSGSLNNWALWPDADPTLSDGPHQYGDAGVGYTWSDGTPDASSTRTTTGIYFGATDGRIQNGYTFTVPASTTARVLRLYFGVYSCRAHVEASLSDLSAPTFVDESLAIHGDNSIESVETITFASASNNQTLTVKVYILEDYAIQELGWHGNVTLMSATLNVPAPHFSLQPISGTNWVGQSQQFSATAVGALPLSYQWYVGTPGGNHAALSDGGQISGATTATLTINNLGPANATNYYVVVTSPYGSATSSVATLTVLPLTGMMSGSIASVPTPVDLTARGTLDWIAFDADGVNADSFDQKVGGTNVISNVTLIDPAATKDNNNGLSAFSWSDGAITPVVALDPNCNYIGGGASNTCTITVPAGTRPKVLTVFAGAWSSDFVIQASLSDSSAPPFVAHYDGGSGVDTMFPWRIAFAAGSDNQTLTVTMYCATKHTSDGGIELAGATLAGPELRLLTSPAANNTNWLGQTQTLSVTVEGIGPFTYQWYVGTPGGSHVALSDGGQFSGATNGTLTINGLVPGNATNYYVVVTSPYGSATSSVASLTILPLTGMMSGSINPVPALLDLTTNGTLDWIVWGYPDQNSFERKAGVVSQISDFTMTGAAAVRDADDSFYDYTWSDGTTTPSGSANLSIYFEGGASTVCSFTVPAGRTPKVLTVYAGAWNAVANLRAELSDYSAPPFVGSFDTGGGAGSLRAWRIPFAAGSEGQILTVTTYVGPLNGGDGGLELGAATLQAAPAIPNQPRLSVGQNGSQVTVSFLTQTGFSYTLQFKTALSDSTWQDVSPSITGDGTMKSVSQQMVPPGRFYRVKVQ
jgi:hypothetical protein